MRRLPGLMRGERATATASVPIARAVPLVALSVGAVLLLSACAAEPVTPSQSPAPESHAPAASGDGVLTIGTLFEIGGSSPEIASAQIAGVELAIREINEGGGVLGAPVRVFHRASGSSDETRVEASFSELVDRNVDVVVGLSSSVLVDRVRPAADEAGIALFSQEAATGAAVDEAFASRVRSMDPAIRVTDFAAEAYDATILAALAVIVADDDGGAGIAHAAAGIASGKIECASLGECRTVLADRPDIRYSSVSGALPPFA